MREKCMCDTPNKELKNTHYLNRKISLSIVEDAWGYGAVLFENHSAIAVFDIDYCPKCGRKLDKSNLNKTRREKLKCQKDNKRILNNY